MRKKYGKTSHSGSSSEEFVVVDIDNVCILSIVADKEFVQNYKSIIDTDYDDENEINNAASDPMSSEMRNIMKNMRVVI
ncbi:hypothetical protein TNCV_656061 [Trichonephila clavipes]|nr:hypothetical protein TNCV_656061 [Trichonephila clavipes]